MPVVRARRLPPVCHSLSRKEVKFFFCEELYCACQLLYSRSLVQVLLKKYQTFLNTNQSKRAFFQPYHLRLKSSRGEKKKLKIKLNWVLGA